MANRPVGENADGKFLAGSAKLPPIAGPMIVPIDQTKGITAYALAADISSALQLGFSWVVGRGVEGERLTFVLGFLDQLAHHGLNDTYVAVCTSISPNSEHSNDKGKTY